MYPTFDNDSPYTQPTKDQKPPSAPPNKIKKTFYSKPYTIPVFSIEEAILDMQKKYPQLSVKPFLSAYEIQVTVQVNAKGGTQQLLLRIVFMQKYPEEKPYVYTGKPIGHQLVHQYTGEVRYDQLMKWNPKCSVVELVGKIHQALNTGITEDKFITYLEDYRRRLDQYSKEIQAIAQRPIPPNAPENYVETLNLPQPPALDFTEVLRQKQFQEQLQNTCENNSAIYQTLLVDYRENESKAQYVSDRFGKGRILKEMEAAAENCEPDPNIVGVENQLNDFFQKRKNYHRMEILKQKYLES